MRLGGGGGGMGGIGELGNIRNVGQSFTSLLHKGFSFPFLDVVVVVRPEDESIEGRKVMFWVRAVFSSET